jgi:hypothetical protein
VRPFDSFGAQRNHAMDTCTFRYRWVFHLDADEVVTPELRDELCAIAAAGEPAYPVYRVPSRLMFMGAWLRHSGQYPSYQVRFGTAEALRFVDYGHGQREVQAPHEVGTLAAPLDHYNFSKGVNDWLARHLRYAQAEAQQARAVRGAPVPWSALVSADGTRRRRALKQASYRMPFRPLVRFLYVYVVRRGFLDGAAGLHYATMIALYDYFIRLNERELERGR